VNFNNFVGNEEVIIVNRTNNNEISLELSHLGWLDDTFILQMIDSQNNTSEIEEFIASSLTHTFNIPLPSLSDENELFLISIYPSLAPELIQTFEVSILSHVLGDVNMDGLVNVQDIVLLISNIVNEENYFELGDLNNDTIINVLDILIIVNIIIQ
jgi:hypothetical protein